MRKIFLVNLIMAIFIIAVLSFNTATPGATQSSLKSNVYYVSADGSDRSPGTEEKPWATIQKAAESAGPGSTVYIKAGTYYERIDIKVSGTKEDGPVTFTNYQEDAVIIDGSKSSAEDQGDLIRISNQNYIKLNGLELINNTGKKNGILMTGIGVWGKGKNIEITNCRIHNISYTGTSVKGGAQAIGIYGNDEESPITGVILEGNEIWDIRCGGSAAVTLSGNVDEYRIIKNQIHDTNNNGLALIGDGTLEGKAVCEKSAYNRARNGFVANNQIFSNSRTNNPCYQKNNYGAAGINANGAKDTTIAYNVCEKNDIGIKIGSETKDCISSGLILRENVIQANNSCGIKAGGSMPKSGWAADCKILNNTLYNNDTEKLGLGEIQIAKSHDLLLSGNIIYTGPQNLAVTTLDLGAQSIYRITMNHNLYYGPGGARGLRFTGVNIGPVGLNMWQSKTQQDADSRIADPKFNDAANKDFHLRQWSKAIDFGDPAFVPEVNETDFDGNQRVNGSAVDCGAFESE